MHIKNIAVLAFISLFIFAIIASCSGGNMSEQKMYDSLDKVPDSAWETLNKKKIYFGHQSVGFNILDGIQQVMANNSKLKLNIVESTEFTNKTGGMLLHSRVGKNRYPDSKVEDFKKILDNGVGEKADIAALKFCFVDVTSKTDVTKVFDEYTSFVDEIKKKYTKLRLIHFTIPLKTNETSWKTWIKKLLGKKEIWEYDDNIKRNEYNELLIEKYKGKDPVFDIAAFESTFPDGKRCTFDKDKKTYYCMVPEYSDDGGHLNEFGSKHVAEALVLLMAGVN